MRYGLSVPNFAEPSRLVELAVSSEAAGWDGFFLWDHIVVDRSSPPLICEPWTTLAGAAVMTTRIRLGTLITPVPRRRPWVLARQVCTVDHLSGGRAVLGVGLGVPAQEEYAALGEPADPKRHGEILDEALILIDALWSGEVADHRGVNFTIDGVCFRPRPLQQPRIPIWCAASLPSRAGVRRGNRWDGVVPTYSAPGEVRPVTPQEVASVVTELQGHGRAERWDVVVCAVAPSTELRLSYARAGATWLIEGPAPGPDWFDHAAAIATAGPPVP